MHTNRGSFKVVNIDLHFSNSRTTLQANAVNAPVLCSQTFSAHSGRTKMKQSDDWLYTVLPRYPTTSVVIICTELHWARLNP